MRVVAGLFKGFRLSFDLSHQLRPTKDRVKEAVFSMIGPKIYESNFLDAFSGTGSIGVEALSRDAHHVSFVDQNVTILEMNLNALFNAYQPSNSYDISRGSLAHFISHVSRSYDIIYLDPPWTDFHLFETSLKLISEFDILEPDGLIVVELLSSHIKEFKKIEHCYRWIKDRKYGRTSVIFLKK